MGAIFSQAILTVAAQSSGDAHGGIFSQIRPFAISHDIANKLSNGKSSTVVLYIPRRWLTLDGTPLTSRGWTLQENILSPRTLHFLDDYIFWECREGYIGHDGEFPATLQNHNFPGGFPSSATINIIMHEPNSLTWSKWEIYLWYTKLVPEYSRRKLTFSRDKLPAIGAIARLVHRQKKSPYLAGLWADELALGLCWHRCSVADSPPKRTSPPSTGRCPSWTWASHDFHVGWSSWGNPSPEDKSHITLLDWHIDLSTSDEFGAISNAELKISAPLNSAFLDVADRSTDTRWGSDGYPNTEPWTVPRLKYASSILDFMPIEYMTLDYPVPSKSVGLMKVQSCHESGEYSTHMAYNLVLARVRENEDRYRRIGFALTPLTCGDGHRKELDENYVQWLASYTEQTITLV